MTLPRAFIFDFDETIIDLEPQHTAASEELCRAMGSDYAQLPESFRTGSGRRVIDDVRELREFFGWGRPLDELLARRQEVFDDVCRRSDLRLMPGVERVIRELHSRGFTLAVTSSAVRNSIIEILQRFELLDLFTVIVDGSEVVRGKPDRQAFIVTTSRLSVDPADCVVFEDSTVGAVAARSAGMFCIAIRNPNAQTQQDLSAADMVLDSFEELDLNVIFSPRERSTPRPAG